MINICININRSITILLKNMCFFSHSCSYRCPKFLTFIFLIYFLANLQDLLVFSIVSLFIYLFFQVRIKGLYFAAFCYWSYCSWSRSYRKERRFSKNYWTFALPFFSSFLAFLYALTSQVKANSFWFIFLVNKKFLSLERRVDDLWQFPLPTIR